MNLKKIDMWMKTKNKIILNCIRYILENKKIDEQIFWMKQNISVVSNRMIVRFKI